MPDGRSAMNISVLIYNVEGLPWPARKNRKEKLLQIGAELKRLRDSGEGPDVVMLQEAFTKSAVEIAKTSGYENVVAGPARSFKRQEEGAEIPREFKKKRKRFRGERFGKFLDSGIYILTDHTVVSYAKDPFSRRACAGFDCLANKGILFARIQLEGVPEALDLFTTHMNSQKASGVKITRANQAHEYQVDEISIFLDAYRDKNNPFVFAGDFNMGNNLSRLLYFTYKQPHNIVRHYCTVIVQDCDVEMSWDGDAPWLDTQDLQFFGKGKNVNLRPIHVQAVFDEESAAGKLSDHDGYLVTYRLTWTKP